jgi:peptide/nickel transport system ATP-binding protein
VALLQFERLSAGYGREPVVSEITLSLEAGRVLGIVGESGSGKSTLARAAVGLAAVSAGRIRLAGVDVAGAEGEHLRSVRRRMQLVFQDPYQSLNPRLTVGGQIGDAVRAHATAGDGSTDDRVASLLQDVRLAPVLAERFPHELSGGQRQRVALARALAAEPDVLVADEITSALDVSVQAGILRLLDRLRRERNLACLFISHDLAVVRALSDAVAVMYCGRIVEQAPAADLFAHPRHPYTRALLDAVPAHGPPTPAIEGEPANPLRPPAGCRFHPRCPQGPCTDPARTRCASADPTPKEGEHMSFVACHFPL